MRTKLKTVREANEEQQMKTEDVPVTPRRGDRDGEKQFKMPAGTHQLRVHPLDGRE